MLEFSVQQCKKESHKSCLEVTRRQQPGGELPSAPCTEYNSH